MRWLFIPILTACASVPPPVSSHMKVWILDFPTDMLQGETANLDVPVSDCESKMTCVVMDHVSYDIWKNHMQDLEIQLDRCENH